MKNDKNKERAAFPQIPNFYKSGELAVTEGGDPGISLRDYFAIKIMQGLLANPGGPIQASSMSGWAFTNCKLEDVVDLAYGIADAMIAARQDGKDGDVKVSKEEEDR